ncbi:phosphodiesterase, MJ0936 family [Arcobacter nitrofigilis DSM 7299]|uniref:Phosphoesterase n=1 Tax=Arcobacter nitrofigilis (strain ATCC 33309 / DSM 7299 / CCUG 15893 / LMG 7604 / NCTC 12251 / CI) TaxID=572480 RepID=D5V7I9_ARCNC|nr:YfcE family phosphodiesterase [Arcobacter nitrofigilis]ADG94609.1 phosphodiesterase, MJ0936 family [Arcobacter nitrofigilis DSM 7299]
MKVAVLSDSHNKVDLTKEAIDFLKSQGAQYLVHAGDLCLKENLELLKESSLPYVCVYGNNDNSLVRLSNEYKIENEPYLFKIEDVKFKLMHLPFYLNADSDVIIFGHTHMFESEYKEGTLFLNPGEICAREKPLSECVLLEINPNEYIINYYSRNINEKEFLKKEIRYDRE